MQKISQNKMAVRPVGSLLITMGFPIMLSMMIQALYNVVDSIFIARVGEDALTAVSLAFPIQMLMISVGVGTAIGVNSLLSRRLGAQQHKEASSVAVHGLFLSVVIWIFFAIFGAILTPFFFQLFTDSPEIIKMGQDYLIICTTLSLGIFGQLVCERIMQGTGNTIHPMITQGVGAIINIILDPIFIFGYFGLPAMGTAGAAIATVIGQWVAMGLALFFMIRKTTELNFKFKRFRPKFRTIKEIYEVGLPSIIMQSIGSVMTIGMNTILIAFSATAVAVFGIYFKLQSFIFLPVFGLTAAMISIVGFNYGARNKERIARTIRHAVLIATGMMLLGILIFQTIPALLLRLFDASPSMLDIGIRALRIISIHFPLAGIAIILSSSFQAIGKGFYSLIISIVRQLGVLLPAAYLLARIWGLDAVWFAFLASEVASLLLAIIFFIKIYRREIATLELPLIPNQG
ncbi:MAG: MATE family efflux transporter [Sphaerochaetaceae bacterium]|jgi:putative MATE family efflux protein|nr:MATE family efflux transporter [Sphaerochaetaceae bacterium]HHU88478.1 MATE family efflux transporter [Spirochaetales bacterium]